jgi:hypothetical protein
VTVVYKNTTTVKKSNVTTVNRTVKTKIMKNRTLKYRRRKPNYIKRVWLGSSSKNPSYDLENNDKYQYPNHKISTQNLVSTGYDNSLFFAKISFGTPNTQVFDLLADTGSSWNWVFTCSKQIKGFHHLSKTMNQVVCPKYYFDSSKSSSIDCTGR